MCHGGGYSLVRPAWAEETTPAEGTAIWLGGSGASDDNDGSSAEKAVASFDKAKEIATGDKSIATIYVRGQVAGSGTWSLSDTTNATLVRAEGYNGYLVEVASGTSLTLTNITIDGNSEKCPNTGKSLVHVSGRASTAETTVLAVGEGATLKNNKIAVGYSAYDAEGGAILAECATVNITGGSIEGNQASLGGGVYLQHAVLNMSGGAITGNAAVDGTGVNDESNDNPGGSLAAGGGIGASNAPYWLDDTDPETTINLSGGSISQNRSDEEGGGIALGDDGFSDRIVLNMTGGTIDGNVAGSAGGGIFVQAGARGADGKANNSVANISGGRITNNKMDGSSTYYADKPRHWNSSFGGGGIYVNGYGAGTREYYASAGYTFDNGVLNLSNAVVTENTAAIAGGGYASCPASATEIYLKNGVALYGNTATGTTASADADATRGYAADLLIWASEDQKLFPLHYGDPTYTISPAMLGGTPYGWTYDLADASDAKNGTEVPLDRLSGTLDDEMLALKAGNSFDSRYQALAHVTISGNSSVTRGGGIGSNGTVVMGEADTTELTVSKRTVGASTATTIPTSVEVEVYQAASDGTDEVVFGHATLSLASDGTGTLTLSGLPKGHPVVNADGSIATNTDGSILYADYSYSVREGDTQGFVASVSGSQASGYTITNVPSTSVTVTKVWDDANDQDGLRPSAEAYAGMVHLLAGADEVDATPTVTDNGDGTYTVTYAGLPSCGEDGTAISYSVREDAVEGYTASADVVPADGTLTNTHAPVVEPGRKTATAPTAKTLPNTGDITSVAGALPVVLGGFGVLAAAIATRRRSRR